MKQNTIFLSVISGLSEESVQIKMCIRDRIYIGIMWASFLLIPVGFIMAVIGFFSKDS